MRFHKTTPPLSQLETLERQLGTKRHTLADFEALLPRALTDAASLTALDLAILEFFGGRQSVEAFEPERRTR